MIIAVANTVVQSTLVVATEGSPGTDHQPVSEAALAYWEGNTSDEYAGTRSSTNSNLQRRIQTW